MPNNIIDSIQLSGVTYGIKGSGGTETIELTQAQYDALVDKDPNVFYIITDAQAGDLTNYYTKTETNTLLGDKADTATTYTKTEVDNAITAATSTKQDTLVSSQNIKTINNQSILGSGNIDIQGGSTYTAGDGIDITNNVISVTGKVSTSDFNTYTAATDTALASKQTTLTAGTNITIVDNVISATGGGGSGKAIEAGTNISVTTGATADTINCTLPMSTDSVKKIVVNSNYSSFVTSDAVFTANSLSNSILLGNNTFNIKGIIKGKINNNLIIGSYNTSNLTNGTNPTLEGNLVVGSNNAINSSYSLLVGNNNTISRSYQFAVGYKQHPNNDYETSLGNYNVSSSGSSTFGDSGNTLFSVGNGTSESARHNAFEIRQNGDIYVPNTDDTSITGDKAYSLYPMVRLQDTITATANNTAALGGLKLVKLTQAQYDALATKDSNTLYVVTDS